MIREQVPLRKRFVMAVRTLKTGRWKANFGVWDHKSHRGHPLSAATRRSPFNFPVNRVKAITRVVPRY